MSPSDRLPLTNFLKVDRELERAILMILQRAASDVDKEIKDLMGKSTFSSQVMADQQRLIKQALHQRMAQSWRQIGHSVSAGKQLAAASAVETMGAYERTLTDLVLSDTQKAHMLTSARLQAQRNVDVAIQRELNSKISLSDQVYKTQALSNGWVDRLVTSSLARGHSARQIAKDVSRFIKPTVPGGMSYAAMRLGRTEINNAFHATSIAYAKQSPFVVAMTWHISGSHPRPDECDDLNQMEFEPEKVPRKPHPMCLCYVTPKVEDEDVFIRKFLAGRYDSFLTDAA